MGNDLALELSRAQFALTAIFHILWPVLTIGLSIFLVAMEALWLKTGDDGYYRHAQFWGKLFILNFGLGVAASSTTQLFMLVGFLPLVPIMLIYTAYQYMVFRGKVEEDHYAKQH